MSNVQINQRNLERLAKELVRNAAQETQKSLNRVYRSHHGSDVNQVERSPERELRNGPASYGKDTIHGWAQLIADNTQVKLRTH